MWYAKSAIGLKMEGEVGVIAPGYRADIICVTGKVEEDLSLLGSPDNITNVMIDGVEKTYHHYLNAIASRLASCVHR